MPSKDTKKCCHDDALNSITQAHSAQNLRFKHTCDTSIHNHKTVTPTPGRVINEYNQYVNTSSSNPTQHLSPQQPYGICHVMKKKIVKAFKKRDREAAISTSNHSMLNDCMV